MPYDSEQPNLNDLGYLVAEAAKNVVFVIGAGLSRPAGLPDWQSLLSTLKAEAATAIQATATSDSDADRQLQRLRSIADPWLAGDLVQEILGEQLFISRVRTSLTTDQIPLTYRAIDALRPSGIISLNLDEIANKVFDCLPDNISTAAEPSKYARFLLSTRQFLLKPHGTLSRPSSWVLGATARNTLLKTSRHYRTFMNQLLAGRRLVFVGVNPTDFAFETLLIEDFRQPHSDEIPHFWIAPDLPDERRLWAETYNIRVIDYTPATEQHDEIYDLLQRLSSFSPRKPPAPLAYEGATLTEKELPSDEELRAEPIEDIRRKLNAALSGLAAEGALNDLQLSQEISAFCTRYAASTHMAWHVTPDHPHNRFFGHRIEHRIGEGSFSTVWRATDVVDHTTLAIKILRQEILYREGFVESFRRGVHAMRILRSEQVRGMVRFQAAFDVPAAVVMEFVDGYTLDDALDAGTFGELADALDLLVSVGEIVAKSHNLPQRVLHRDLKPSNIMIRKPWQPDSPLDVVVLDFDLSWYEGAMGRTMLGGGTLNFAAPEQLDPSSPYSTRHTAVDVFGFGALLYYIATGSEPQRNVQNRADFITTTQSQIDKRWSPSALSTGTYLTLTINSCMSDDQGQRPPLVVVTEQLRRAISVLRSHQFELPSELLLLELGIRVRHILGDTWQVKSADESEYLLQSTLSPASVRLTFEDIGAHVAVSVKVASAATGSEPRGNVAKYLRTRGERSSARLAAGRIFIVSTNPTQATVVVTGSSKIEHWTLDNCGAAAEAIAHAAMALAMD